MERGAFSVEVERELPIAVVRPRGHLDAYAAPDLRAALLAALADQPTGVIVDAAEVKVVDEAALAALVSVARESERWPGTPFAVVGPPETLMAVKRLGMVQSILSCPDWPTALSALADWPQPPSRRQRIEPDRDAPSTARQAVREFCEEHQVGGDGDAAN